MLFLLLFLPCQAFELTLPNLEPQFSQLAVDTSPCTTDALAEFITQCGEKGIDGIDPELRLQLAVRLSLCEFAEAGVDYPVACDLGDWKRCTGEFRKLAQLWTTYSGNYRKLRTVCYEEAVPHVKKHILGLFFNVTKVYEQFYAAAANSARDTEAVQVQLSEKVQKLANQMVLLVELSENNRLNVESSTERFFANMVQRYLDLELLMDAALRSQHSVHIVESTLERAHQSTNMLLQKLSESTEFVAEQNSVLTQHAQWAQDGFVAVASLVDTVQISQHMARTLQAQLKQGVDTAAELAISNSNAKQVLVESLQQLQLLVFATTESVSVHIDQVVSGAVDVIVGQLGGLSGAVREASALLDAHQANISRQMQTMEKDLSRLEKSIGVLGNVTFGAIFQRLVLMAKAALVVLFLIAIYAVRVHVNGFMLALLAGAVAGLLLRATLTN